HQPLGDRPPVHVWRRSQWAHQRRPRICPPQRAEHRPPEPPLTTLVLPHRNGRHAAARGRLGDPRSQQDRLPAARRCRHQSHSGRPPEPGQQPGTGYHAPRALASERAGHCTRFLCRSHGDDHRTTPVQPPTSRQHGTGWPQARQAGSNHIADVTPAHIAGRQPGAKPAQPASARVFGERLGHVRECFAHNLGVRTTGVTMAKGYWINQSDVTDEAGHAKYGKAVAEYLARRGAKTLVFSEVGRREVVEGSPRGRQLVQEFPDYESALAAYRSEEYQEIKKLRLNTATIDLVIAEGFDPSARPDREDVRHEVRADH